MLSQFMVINKILSTKDFSIISQRNLTADYFFNYKDEFNFIKNHVDTTLQVPDKLTFVAAFPNWKFQEVNEPDSYLMEQLYDDYNVSFLGTGLNVVGDLINAGKSKEAVEAFQKLTTSFHADTEIKCVDIISDLSRFDRFVDKCNNLDNYYISTGFKELDALIGGIDLKNENMVIIARPGVGKSWLAMCMAVAAAKQGKTVGFYSGEMSVDKVAYRMDTLIGHVKNGSLNHGDITYIRDYQNYINELKNERIAPIKIITPFDIGGPATVGALTGFVERENIEVLVIDQYSLLEDSSRARAENEKIANISKSVKHLQTMKQIPIISVSQMNRPPKDGDGEAGTARIFGSDRIGQDATIVLSISKKQEAPDPFGKKKPVLFEISVDKARDGGDGTKLTYTVDLNRGKFEYLDPNSTTEENEDLAAHYGDTDALTDAEVML